MKKKKLFLCCSFIYLFFFFFNYEEHVRQCILFYVSNKLLNNLNLV